MTQYGVIRTHFLLLMQAPCEQETFCYFDADELACGT